ncbi:MAG: DUF4956 domain-containing protein [Blautia sp.]|nr:DUF4956 domain-containing protein [Blautia sp.]MCM1201444.1 DUF4956 domain-containing protein [Bacteroides fragilis]
MSVRDVIKNSVFEALGGGSGLSAGAVILILAMACVVGIYIFTVYKLSAKSAFYSKDLNVTMAGLPIIVAAIMIAMQSNLLVSLGMVGALSIVRFRNAVKNPVDLLYLFWSISAGIIVGVGLYVLGIVLCIIMTVLLLVLDMVPHAKAPELLVLRGMDKKMDYDKLYKTISGYCRSYKEKARSIKNGEAELIIEIRVKEKDALLEELDDMDLFTQINCLSHDGECRI